MAMFIFGAGLFTYQGAPLSPLASEAGMYSFILWLPTLILGAILTSIKPKKSQ